MCQILLASAVALLGTCRKGYIWIFCYFCHKNIVLALIIGLDKNGDFFLSFYIQGQIEELIQLQISSLMHKKEVEIYTWWPIDSPFQAWIFYTIMLYQYRSVHVHKWNTCPSDDWGESMLWWLRQNDLKFYVNHPV